MRQCINVTSSVWCSRYMLVCVGSSRHWHVSSLQFGVCRLAPVTFSLCVCVCNTAYLWTLLCLILAHCHPGNLVSVATGRHTFVPLCVMLALQVPALLGLFLLWRHMATDSGQSSSGQVLPRCGTEKLAQKEATKPVNATNPVFFVTPLWTKQVPLKVLFTYYRQSCANLRYS